MFVSSFSFACGVFSSCKPLQAGGLEQRAALCHECKVGVGLLAVTHSMMMGAEWRHACALAGPFQPSLHACGALVSEILFVYVFCTLQKRQGQLCHNKQATKPAHPVHRASSHQRCKHKHTSGLCKQSFPAAGIPPCTHSHSPLHCAPTYVSHVLPTCLLIFCHPYSPTPP